MEWIDKRDELDDILADDINKIAHSCIDLEQEVAEKADEAKDYSERLNAETTERFNSVIGDIDEALDKIIEIQEALIGGGGV